MSQPSNLGDLQGGIALFFKTGQGGIALLFLTLEQDVHLFERLVFMSRQAR